MHYELLEDVELIELAKHGLAKEIAHRWQERNPSEAFARLSIAVEEALVAVESITYSLERLGESLRYIAHELADEMDLQLK